MEHFIALLVIRLLKQNIGADSRVLQLPVVLNRGGGDIDIHTANGSIFMLYGINGINTFQYVFDGIPHRIFPRLNSQTFMAHVLKSNHFLCHFLLRQFFAGDVFVLSVVRTVGTAIDTVVG